MESSVLLGDSKNIHFVVVGGASNFVSRAYSLEIARRARLHEATNFHLIGYVDDELLHNLFYHSDLYLSVSQSEACNLALIEAASYRLPIITTDVGAAKDLFFGEVTFLDRYCTRHDIAKAVIKNIGKPRVDYSARQRITWEKALEKLFRFYNQVI